LPADVVVISAAERDDLADRLFQMLCAAEDVATALAESASRAELADLVEALLSAAHAAERLR
jgi:Lon protease-like protein